MFVISLENFYLTANCWTRTRPTSGDITNINGAIDVVMKENNGFSYITDPAQDPFFLSLAS